MPAFRSIPLQGIESSCALRSDAVRNGSREKSQPLDPGFASRDEESHKEARFAAVLADKCAKTLLKGRLAILSGVSVGGPCVARRLLLRDANIVFGYLAEDLIAARRLASHERTGFYVDVGCNDPVKLSNTLLLYGRGWSGINIDANPKVVERVRRGRPRDRALCALVGRPGELREFVVFADDALSTADPALQATWSSKTREAERFSLKPCLKTRSLTSVLDELAPIPPIHFLDVDVEGMDNQVLASHDFERFPVGLVAVEIHGFDASHPGISPTVSLLDRQGFRLVAYNGLTAFFGRKSPEGFWGGAHL